MQSIFLIIPDFLLILLGSFLAHGLKYSGEFWRYCEKLVFYVLFPPLLFLSVKNAHIAVADASVFLTVAVGAMLLAVVSSYCVRYVHRTDAVTTASAFQCGFRFNTYIGFALCLRLYGSDGFSLLALLIAFWVPISNVIAVAALAAAVSKNETVSAGQRLVRVVTQVVKNPLIIATVLGLIANVTAVPLPGIAETFLKSLGNASLALGLLCIGASLKVADLKENFSLMTVCTAQRLIVVPAVAYAVALLCGLDPLSAGVLVLFAALPTAQSCYVMTAAMGGNAPAVADITTSQTLFALVTLPLWTHFVLLPLASQAGF